MHVISYGSKLGYSPLYPRRTRLARPDCLANIFRNLRIHRNLTRGALAAKFGLSEEYVCAIEVGSKFPSLKFCLLCGQEFGANPNWVRKKWANERIVRFSHRLMNRLGLVE